jgi:hypothetical protein
MLTSQDTIQIADLARLGVDSALMARPTQIHQF